MARRLGLSRPHRRKAVPREAGRLPGYAPNEARLAYARIREQRDRGVDLAARRQRAAQHDRSSPTVKALCRDYIDRHAKPNKRTWVQDERMLDKDVIPAWGRLKAEGITRTDVVTLLDRISDRGSPMQAGKVLALVRKVWNFGIDRGVLALNPAARIPGLQRPESMTGCSPTPKCATSCSSSRRPTFARR